MNEKLFGLLYEADPIEDGMNDIAESHEIDLGSAMHAIRAAKFRHPAFRNREHLIDGTPAPQAEVIPFRSAAE